MYSPYIALKLRKLLIRVSMRHAGGTSGEDHNDNEDREGVGEVMEEGLRNRTGIPVSHKRKIFDKDRRRRS